MDGLTEGRIVHYVLPFDINRGSHRAAIVVRVWRDGEDKSLSNGLCQLNVFTDGSNDGPIYSSGSYWATSVHFSENGEPGTWHWIERS